MRLDVFSRFRWVLAGVGVAAFAWITPGALPAAEGELVPVVVAIDTSRSLSQGELSATAALAASVVAELPVGVGTGLMAFDDSPTWLIETDGTPAKVSAALATLTPSGNFTLLNDALFSAARGLPDGGVIVLLTDGRDENSATTVEDVANLCAANHVRIVSLSVGRRIDEKALRRLALLSDGAYLGRQGRAPQTEVVESVRAAQTQSQQEVAEEAEAARLAAEAAAGAQAEVGLEERPQTVVKETPSWLLPLLVVLTLAVLATPVLLWFWRRSQVQPMAIQEDWDTDPAFVPGEADSHPDETESLPPPAPMAEEAEELHLDPSAYERLPFDGQLEQTSVLDERHVLIVRIMGQPPRTFRLQDDRAFAVGRAPGVNTLTLEEKTLSGQHFKIVPHEGGYVVVDLESTNGTLVNGRRVKARRLESGDQIRAGEVECEFRVMLKPLA